MKKVSPMYAHAIVARGKFYSDCVEVRIGILHLLEV